MSVLEQETKPKPKPSEIANKYLQVYNADIDWLPYINELKDRLRSRPDAISELKKRLACTILLPYHDSNTVQDPPQNLLFFCHKWQQYDTRDWNAEYEKVLLKDEEIAVVRAKALALGIVFPYEYNPNCRQAFKWLHEHAEASGDMNDTNREFIVNKLKNIVYAYGGVVVCSVFQKPELEYKIKKIPNWRSGYFFEKLIHEIYKDDEIVKIKTHELNKIRSADPTLIKTINPKE